MIVLREHQPAPRSCELVGRLLAAGDGSQISCNAGRLSPTLAAVNLLCHVQLTARRLGSSIEFCQVGYDLQALLDFVGLTDALLVSGELLRAVDTQRKVEQGKQVGVDEGVDPANPTR